MPITSDIQKLEPGKLIELYELDATEIGGVIQRFHGYADNSTIYWDGNGYEPWSIKAEGFARSSNGQQPNPTLTVGNIGKDINGKVITGVISALCLALDDLVGAKLTRHRTFLKYLDAANWTISNGSPKLSNGRGILLSNLDSGNGSYVGNILKIYSGPGSVQEGKIASYIPYATGSQWKQNLLRYSNTLTNAIWAKVNVTVVWDDAEKAHLMTVTADSTSSVTAVYQADTAFSPSGKQITAQAWVKGVGSMIGKQVRVYTYKESALEPVQQTLTLTANWQLLKLTRSFTSASATTLVTRFDFALPAIAGDAFFIKDAQVFEGSEAGYIETSASAMYPGPAVITEQPLQQNLVIYSSDGVSAAWPKNNMTAVLVPSENATKVTVAGADPYINQAIPFNRKRLKTTFTVEVKGVGTGIGRVGALYAVRSAQGNNPALVLSNLFTATSQWQKLTWDIPIDEIGASSFVVRIDFPQVGTINGDEELMFRKVHVYEGEAASYVETTGTRYLPVNATSGYQVLTAEAEGSAPDPTQEMPPEIWIVEQKSVETSEAVEFVLSSPLNFDGKTLPGRQILASMCPFLWKGGYRGPYCGYTGNRYFDVNDNPVFDPALDKCGGRVKSCKLRFDPDPLNYGGFESADRITGR